MSEDKLNTICKPNSSDLYNRLSLFGEFLNPNQKRYFLLIALYNDLRLFEPDPEKRLVYIKELCISTHLLWENFNCKQFLPINKDNWQEQIIQANRTLSWIPGTKPLERSFVLNRWLVDKGLCPLVHFAFDQWYEIGQLGDEENKIVLANLADLSTTFLYRLISVPVPETFVNNSLIGGGAYSNVYRSNDDQVVFKVPKNMASYHFASEEEYQASRFAETTYLNPYIPKTLSFDPQTKIIQREFVVGVSGFELLQDPDFRSFPYAIEDIKAIYHAACNIYRTTGVNFDIHPGNIMWSIIKNNWILVDLGPMPSIGAEYFPRDSFEDYFQKIWLDLNDLMINVPIRSLDIIDDKTNLSNINTIIKFNL